MKKSVLLTVLMVLYGCQPPLCLYFYNAQQASVVYTTYSSLGKHGYYPKNRTIGSQKVFEKKSGVFIHPNFQITTSSGVYCYQPAYHSRNTYRGWVDHDRRIVSMYALLGEDNKIYVFDKRSFGKKDYYLDEVPEQPPGFPISPVSADECERILESYR